MIKAIFLDVDGTMVSFQTHTMSKKLVEGLHALREKGISLFVSTGRQKAMLNYVTQTFSFDGYITMSGQYCYIGEQVLLRNPMPPQGVEELVLAAQTEGFSCIFLEGEDVYLNCINQLTEQFIQDLSISMPPVRPAEYALGREIYQAVVFLDPSQEHQLLQRAPHLQTTRWHPGFLDVMPATGGKDKGVEVFLNHLGLKREECMAFGDGENDLSMLQYAGIGVAMGTASDQVKGAADYVTGTVDEDGILTALEHFGIL